MAALASVFFATGFYNVAFYVLRRGPHREREQEESDLIYLLFGLHCLFAGLRLLLDQNGPAQFFFRADIINEHIRLIYLLLVALGTISVIIFSILAFELKCGRAMRLVWAAILGLPLLLLIVLPNPVSPFHAMLQILPFLLIIVLAAKSLSLARLRARPYLGLYFIALCVFFFWGAVVNAGAVSYGFAGFTLHNVFFTLAQFTMLSQEYTKARHRARELAANDYLGKPFSYNVLLARLSAMFRNVEEVPEILEKGPLKLDIMAGIAYLKGVDMLLTQKEFALLLLFVRNEGRALSAEYLYEKVWRLPAGGGKGALKNMVYKLRKKLEAARIDICFSRRDGYTFFSN